MVQQLFVVWTEQMKVNTDASGVRRVQITTPDGRRVSVKGVPPNVVPGKRLLVEILDATTVSTRPTASDWFSKCCVAVALFSIVVAMLDFVWHSCEFCEHDCCSPDDKCWANHTSDPTVCSSEFCPSCSAASLYIGRGVFSTVVVTPLLYIVLIKGENA